MIENSVEVPEKEVRKLSYERRNGLVGLMDCGGSNISKLNEQMPGVVRLIATARINHPDVKARQRANELGVPLVEMDLRQYESERGVKPREYLKVIGVRERGELEGEKTTAEIVREDFCRKFLDEIHKAMDKAGIPRGVPVFAAGFMQLLSKEFVEAFDIFNIHPGDVTKYEIDGEVRGKKRIIVGDGWVPPARAISAGHDVLYSSMHRMTAVMDDGQNIMRGYGLPIDYNFLLSRVDVHNREVMKRVGSAAQNALKYLGDHVIAGATFLDLFDGNWGIHKTRTMAYRSKGKWYLAPNGISIEDHVANNPGTVFQRTREFIDEKVRGFHDGVAKI